MSFDSLETRCNIVIFSFISGNGEAKTIVIKTRLFCRLFEFSRAAVCLMFPIT